MSRFFHFTLGPVQGFVAQARRTRDFWAGSFILSWLSAVAMRAVQAQRGEVIFPVPDEAFMAALETGGTGPKQGNVPNRFKALVEDGFDPKHVEWTVREAWERLTEHVWQADLEGNASTATRSVWERQIRNFWDIQWVLEDGDDPSALDRLKNWRTHLPEPEPGVKCMMMDGWQELSGEPAPGRRPQDPAGPHAFWQKLRTSGTTGIATDLRPNEMLCAIAYVKRRFARHFAKFSSSTTSGFTLRGWRLPHGVPSVHYMAAAPWLGKLLAKAAQDQTVGECMRVFHDAAYALTGAYGEWNSNIYCVQQADTPKMWNALDGTVFFDAFLENQGLWKEQAEEAKQVLTLLKALRVKAQLDPVSPFYAVLLMDGDELGAQMSDATKQETITKGLRDFTRQVPDVVARHSGFLVYAGGDDVLALLPLEYALPCAADLRRTYMSCFPSEATAPVQTSISGAIEYTHIKMPLGKVLADAHRLLDTVAKDDRGRDSIACRVWKPGGLTVEWAMPWECALDGTRVELDRLAESFRARDAENAAGEAFASKFFYRIRERFDLLNPAAEGQRPVLDETQAVDLLAVEYLNSGVAKANGVKNMAQARQVIAPLLAQCRPVKRDKTKKPHSEWPRDPRILADGALLVRFLANKGVER